MKRNTESGIILIFFIFLIIVPQYTFAQDISKDYIDQQKSFYEGIIELINPSIYEEYEREHDFDPCPMEELNDDFLSFHFKSIHSEQAGFLDCDGPTFLSIYDNGLYINHTGDREYKCYLKNFEMTYSGLKSGTTKLEVAERFGLPIIQSELIYIYSCTLDVDPFAGIVDDSEPVDVDESDPDNYILDFFFVFKNDKLIAVIHTIDYYCY